MGDQGKKEEFKDTKGVTRNRKLKDRQHNGQKEKDTHQFVGIKIYIEHKIVIKCKLTELLVGHTSCLIFLLTILLFVL